MKGGLFIWPFLFPHRKEKLLTLNQKLSYINNFMQLTLGLVFIKSIIYNKDITSLVVLMEWPFRMHKKLRTAL